MGPRSDELLFRNTGSLLTQARSLRATLPVPLV